MILERIIAPVFAANCYVLASGPGAPALVVDPGAGSVAGALALLRAHHLSLGTVLLTHGHADHVWDTAALVDAARAEGLVATGPGQAVVPGPSLDSGPQVPVWIPQPDLYRLDDPAATTAAVAMGGLSFTELAGTPWRRPAQVGAFPESGYTQPVELVPGISVRAVPAPGHTEGSTLFFLTVTLGDDDLLREAEVPALELAGPSEADVPHDYLLALDGDVIFKGSVGRTDLPGGDQTQMLATLRFLAQAVDPDTVLLPGHGAATTMAHEHHANPYLAEAKIHGGEYR